MKHRPDTPDGIEELRMLSDGQRIFWFRELRQLKRDITIYPQTLTPKQQQRLNEIEQELLAMAYEASEVLVTKTVLKGK